MLTFKKLEVTTGLFGHDIEGVYKDGKLVAYITDANTSGNYEDTRLFTLPLDNQVCNLHEFVGDSCNEFHLKRADVKAYIQQNPKFITSGNEVSGVVFALLDSGRKAGLCGESFTYGMPRFTLKVLSGKVMNKEVFKKYLPTFFENDHVVKVYFWSGEGAPDEYTK